MVCLLGLNSQIILNISQHDYSFQTEGLINHSCKVSDQGHCISLLKISMANYSLWKSKWLYYWHNEFFMKFMKFKLKFLASVVT